MASDADRSGDPGRRGDGLRPDELVALRELLDRQAIVDCIHRCARGVDRADLELVRAAYHDDAIEDHGAYVGGVDGLIEFLRVAHAPFVGYQRHVTNTSVEVDGDTAHAESYYLCALRRDPDGRVPAGGGLLLNGGRYLDRLQRRDGCWRILRRVVVMEWEASLDGGAPKFDVTVAARHDRTDASYDRPLDVTREHRSPFPPA